MLKKDPLNFEVLCVDSTKTSKLQTRDHVLYSLASNGELFTSPRLDHLRYRIDGDDVSASVKEVDAGLTSETLPQRAFFINVRG